MRARFAFLSLALLPACSPTVGSPIACEDAAPISPGPEGSTPRCPDACDPFAARAVVHDLVGTPYYAGQALVISTCSSGGAFCHASNASDRIGAPATLDFDLLPITDPAAYDAEIDALADLQARVRTHRNLMWGQIVSGAMPPGNEGELNIVREYGFVVDPLRPEMDVLLPEISSPEGQEIVRNWLACGAPMVERTFSVPTPSCTVGTDCPSGTCVEGRCAPAGDEAPAIVRFIACEVDTDCPSGTCGRTGRCILDS